MYIRYFPFLDLFKRFLIAFSHSEFVSLLKSGFYIGYSLKDFFFMFEHNFYANWSFRRHINEDAE